MYRIFRIGIVILPLVIGMIGCQPVATAPGSVATATPLATDTPSATAVPSTTRSPVPPATPTFGLLIAQPWPTNDFHLPTWTTVESASPQAAIQIKETHDIPYTSKQLLDVYAPVEKGNWPLVIAFHGGDDFKSGVSDIARAVAPRGAVVFAPTYYSREYNLSVPIAQSSEDAACAVRFARAHASEYGGNADRVIVVGHSFGGTKGALLMLAGDDFHGDCLTQEGSALPDAFVGLDGAYDLIPIISPTVLQEKPVDILRNNPITYIRRTPKRENVSFLLFVGSTYELRAEGQMFRDNLQSAGYNVRLFQISGADHNAMVRPWPATVDAIASLLHP